jgi:hypothetical protein
LLPASIAARANQNTIIWRKAGDTAAGSGMRPMLRGHTAPEDVSGNHLAWGSAPTVDHAC